jgi:hypothetical protein
LPHRPARYEQRNQHEHGSERPHHGPQRRDGQAEHRIPEVRDTQQRQAGLKLDPAVRPAVAPGQQQDPPHEPDVDDHVHRGCGRERPDDRREIGGHRLLTHPAAQRDECLACGVAGYREIRAVEHPVGQQLRAAEAEHGHGTDQGCAHGPEQHHGCKSRR